MNYLWHEWQKIKEKIKNKYIFLFLDYDGTLTPLVDTPQAAIIPKETKTLLKELTKSLRVKIAIISGRALLDIKNKVGLKNIIYVGNHGLEIKGSKIRFESPTSVTYKAIIGKIKSDLAKRLSSIKGVILEDKGLSLSIHYRLVDKKYIPKVKTIVHETTILYAVRNKIKIKPGKEVLEIRPPLEWDKGKTVLWLLGRQKFALGDKPIIPIYIGDDITDEDAFRVLRNKGLTICVGVPNSSEAKYYLKDTKEVLEFLKIVSETEKMAKLCQN